MAYIDEKTSRQVSHIRVMRSRQLLEEHQGKVTPEWMMRIAYDHSEDVITSYSIHYTKLYERSLGHQYL